MAPAGNFSDRVTFQRLTPGIDGYGNTVNGWVNYLTVWADILETPGREAISAGRIEASRSATMRIRRSPSSRTLTEADRVLARDRVWNVRSIGDVGRDRTELEFVIETGVSA
jgi:SPP1 family predicted phage head-tail adaptor